MLEKALQYLFEQNNANSVQGSLDAAGFGNELQATAGMVEITDLEPYMQYRKNYRGTMRTSIPEEFYGYCESFDEDTEPGACCFIDADDMSAATIFDNGTSKLPGHRRHKAVLGLRKTSLYKALLDIVGGQLSQKQAAEFLEDYSEEIEAFSNAGDSMLGAHAAQSLRNLTIERAREVNSQVDDFAVQASALERIEAKNKDAIVSRFAFCCVPYTGLDLRNFEVRVALVTSSSEPRVTFRIIRHEVHVDDMAMEFKDKVKTGLGSTDISVTVGTFSG